MKTVTEALRKGDPVGERDEKRYAARDLIRPFGIANHEFQWNHADRCWMIRPRVQSA